MNHHWFWQPGSLPHRVGFGGVVASPFLL
ncbi:hypothetical protein [Hymenobacter sp. BT178]|uniref:Uncharacterized protein n=1 Tax=Hymenobacter lucidus TaxID=2880930 RepID=A0ABS8AY20_9BACT|nr:hypothetical protein [Hymenobacter lucidus]